MIPPPNAAIPLVNPILRTSLLCQIWDSPPDYLIEMRQLVSIQNSIFKSIRKLIFPAFGTILVLVAACLYSKFLSKSIQKLIFPAFGTILVLVAACFYSKYNSKKVLQIWCFQLLAQSWFQWQLFSSQNSIQKSIANSFSSFWRDLGFGGSFFLQKNFKKIQKGYLLQTQPYPWWTLYLEPPFCIRFGLVHLIRMRQDEIRDMMRCVFMTRDVCKYNSTK